jgi:hypothetical protein
LGIYRGAGGTGDAVNDASSEATLVQELVDNATTQANNAATSATAAQSAETQAVISQGLAADSATAAASSASSASSSASTATTQATNASNSATAAQTAETAAELAETNAETAQAAAASSASAASTSATNASNSASSASTSATNASNSATAAATSATNAAASYDAFDDRYLGSKSSNPTVDNDGNALLTGALYFNTTVPEMRLYNGSSWIFIGSGAAAGVESFNTRTGAVTLTSSDVTTALTYTPLAPAAIGTTVQAYDADLTTLGAGGSSARSFLGLAIGTDVQAYDADLTTLGAGGSSARSFLGLAIGTDVQAYDAQLADIAGLTPTDNSFIVGNGTNFVAENASTARTSLGVVIGTDVQAYDADTTKNDVANTFSANQIISVTDNSNAALRITQLGTGNALLVEDNTNPDSTPFVIDQNGAVVIGETAPYAAVAAATAITPKFQLIGTSVSTSSTGQFAWNTNPYHTFNKSLGSAGVYTAVTSGTLLGAIQFNGADGSAFSGATSIQGFADSNATAGIVPGRLAFNTGNTSGNLIERMRITNSGNIGIATDAPAAKLQVAGNTILSNVDMLNASYDSVSFSIAGEELTPQGIFFSPDGTKMYVIGTTGDDVNQYSLSTPWLVSSATYVTVFSVASQDLTPTGLFFRADGLKMYVVGNTNDTVFQYSLTTPWSVATASYDSVSFSVTTQETTPNGVFFKPNGLTMYITGSTGDAVYQYTLSTAWNVSTATFTQSFSVGSQEIAPSDVSFTGDGTRMFLLGTTGDDVTVYNLTTPWDISTASHIGQFSVAGQDTGPAGIYVKPDGTKFYIVGNTNDSVYQYTIPSIDIQLTGTTTINGSATVAQDLTVDGNFSALNVYSGTYTPTQVSTNTNVTAVTYNSASYMRVGSVVTVSGRVDITATATGNTVVQFSLPIASAFAATSQGSGTGAQTSGTIANNSFARLSAQSTDDCILLQTNSTVTTSASYFYTFTYRII